MKTDLEKSSGPKISIVMPSFNQARYIERSIKSVLNQDYSNIELIIVDGGSTDGTVDIIRRYEPHLAYWISEGDRGQSDALNKGFKVATGEIYGWLNSDDIYLPRALSTVARAFSQQQSRSIVFGDWQLIDEEDRLIRRERAFDFNLNHFKYEGFHCNAQAMFWRSHVHRRFGGFQIDLHRTMDYQMIIAFGTNEGDNAFERISMEFAAFRRHPEQKTTGMDTKVLAEHRLVAQSYGFSDKYTPAGKLKRLKYRFRRLYWYWKRGGATEVRKRLSMARDVRRSKAEGPL